MALENQLSRYGSITKAIPELAPGAKLFLVSDSDDTTVGPLNLGSEFPTDKDGVARVYTTIQAAVNAATAGRGDVVLVLPGYDQSLTAADTWATAGVHVVGLGGSTNRPTLRYTGTAGEVGIAANNVHVKNLRFLAATDSCTRALDLDTGFSGAHIEGCVFDFNATTNNFLTMLRVGQARSIIENNEFRAEDTAGAGRAIGLLGGYADFLKIRKNFFYGQFDTNGDTSDSAVGAIAMITSHDSGDTVLSGVEIAENTIVATDTATSVLINLNPTAVSPVRGLLRDNRLATYDTAAADTAQINLGATGGFLALNNVMITGDSDVQQSIVGRQVMRGVLDSG